MKKNYTAEVYRSPVDSLIIRDCSGAIGAPQKVKSIEQLNFKQKILQHKTVDRVAYILSQVSAGQDVLHVGCSDSPYTALMLDSNRLIHAELLQKNSSTIGVDCCTLGLNILKKEFPNSKFCEGDAEDLDRYFPENTFDLIIGGEILEHLSNPGIFLSHTRKLLKSEGRLILTVPNVFGIRRFIHSFFYTENYHPDHTAYFSENTLRVLASRTGFEVASTYYYATIPGKSWSKKILYFFIEKMPAVIFGSHYLEGLVLNLKVKK